MSSVFADASGRTNRPKIVTCRYGCLNDYRKWFCQISCQLRQASSARGELQAFCMMLSAMRAPLQKRERREEAETIWL
jgi:hypothetical protein